MSQQIFRLLELEVHIGDNNNENRTYPREEHTGLIAVGARTDKVRANQERPNPPSRVLLTCLGPGPVRYDTHVPGNNPRWTLYPGESVLFSQFDTVWLLSSHPNKATDVSLAYAPPEVRPASTGPEDASSPTSAP